MKKSINRNYFACEFTVSLLAKLGIKNVVISPGSRSTPLTIAFEKNDKISKHVIIDERSAGFFALGLAKKSENPVAIVTTSGTAVAELYPAIIEAYNDRVPLIICTADRPHYLRNTGSNQTINQENIFRNHARCFEDLKLPRPSLSYFKTLAKRVCSAVILGTAIDKGPVHLNFPFEKPLEPSLVTDAIDAKKAKEISVLIKSIKFSFPPAKGTAKIPKQLIERIAKSQRTIIICGPFNYENKFYQICHKLSSQLNAPIFADGLSGFRFRSKAYKNVVDNFNSILRSKDAYQNLVPDVILHFGNAPTSNKLLNFFSSSNAYKVLINEFGDVKDPSRSFNFLVKSSPEVFCKELLSQLQASTLTDFSFSKDVLIQNRQAENIKNEFFPELNFPSESRVILDTIKFIPAESNLFVSNSIPVRDLDFFSSKISKKISVFSNRGASGIDGIISTANGIAINSKLPTVLITGDLSFYYDIGSLLYTRNLEIPLVIVLINNNGGAIFNMLPVANEKIDFNKYFTTPHNLEFKNIVRAFGGNFISVKGWKHFESEFHSAIEKISYSVLEIKTDPIKSLDERKNFWKLFEKEINR